MLRFTVIAIFILICAPAHAQEQDTEATRLAAVDRYLQGVNQAANVETTFLEMLQAVPQEMREPIAQVLTGKEFNAKFDRLMRENMAKRLTTQEIDAMTAYYASALGKSAEAKMAVINGELVSELMKEMQAAIAEHRARQRAEQAPAAK